MRRVIHNALRPLTSSSVLRNAGTLMVGTLAAQAFAVLISPVLGRLYDPSAFGALGFYLAVTNILLVLGTARFENAIVLPRRQSEALSLRRLSSLIAIAVALMAAALVVAYSVFGQAAASRMETASLAWLIPVSAAALGLHQAMSGWWLRLERYKTLSTARVVRSVGAGTAQLCFAPLLPGAAGLILGQTVGHCAAAITLREHANPEQKRARTSFRRLLVLAHKYARFPKLELPQALLNSAAQQLPILLLSALFDAFVTGCYVMAARVLILPIQLIGQTLRQVIVKQASLAKQQARELYPLVRSSVISLALIGAIPAVVLMLYAPGIFSFVLGSKWHDAGQYASALAPWLYLIFVKEGVLGIVPAFEAQGTVLRLEVVGLPLRAAGLSIGAFTANPAHSIIAYSVVGAAMNAILITRLMTIARDGDSKLAPA